MKSSICQDAGLLKLQRPTKVFRLFKVENSKCVQMEKNYGFLLAEVERRVELQGIPLQKAYLNEFNTDCFY